MDNLKRLPLSRVDFSAIRNNNMIYIDKTDLIAKIARADANVAFFIGRPRRFGKTLLLNTFEELFSNGLKSFKGLKIQTQGLWTDSKTYPVLHIDFSKFKEVSDVEAFKSDFCDVLKIFIAKYKINIPFTSTNPVSLAQNIFETAKEQNLVLLIDEYDAPLNSSMLRTELFEQLRQIYSNFMATIKSYEGKFRFIFITGITRYTHASIFSPFNIIYDITLDSRYQSLLGYSDEELKTYFQGYLEKSAQVLKLSVKELHAKLKAYYDGYYFNPDLKVNLYCPFSILNFFSFPENGFANYWNASGAGTQVVNNYFKKRPLSVTQIFNGYKITNKNYNSGLGLEKMNYAVLLQQAGYYSFKEGSNSLDYVLNVPNKEVADTIYPLVFEYETKISIDDNENYDNIISGFRAIALKLFAGDESSACEDFNNCLNHFGYDAFKAIIASEAVLRDILALLFNIALNTPDPHQIYTITREELNLSGRADLTLELNHQHKVIIELKIATNKTMADKKLGLAIEQIKTHDYGNNGYIASNRITSYALVFYKAKTKKFAVLGQKIS